MTGSVLEPINGDYLYSELINPAFIQDGENVKVSVSVKFIDKQTKATQISQFELVLYKGGGYDDAPEGSNLTSFVRKLRRKFEPDPDNPQYILTVWGVGYTFSKEKP